MRSGILTIGLATLVAGASTLSLAQGMPRLLCAVSLSTGFNWEGGRWVQTNFLRQNYLVSRVDEEGHWPCELALLQEEATTNAEPGAFGGQTRYGCWSLATVGEVPNEASGFRLCLEYYTDSLALERLDCDRGNNTWAPPYTISQTTLGQVEFVRWGSDIVRSEDGGRADSLFMEVGACSVL